MERTLEEQRAVLWDYLLLAVELQDMHGIRDACVDIEKVEARMQQRTVDGLAPST